jgi:hypothetical protein
MTVFVGMLRSSAEEIPVQLLPGNPRGSQRIK